jgi:hypothetical protein
LSRKKRESNLLHVPTCTEVHERLYCNNFFHLFQNSFKSWFFFFYIISNVITIVVINSTERPVIKKNSAMFSYLLLSLSLLLRIDKKDKRLLVIKEMVAIAVNSSIMLLCFSLSTLREVKTMKQSPSRFDEVFSIWEDLVFSTFN